ncbi:pentatricopeptide repeat-containing protein At2g33680-like [Aristolochia californica]|uniref:pentatricopeptide repeat-containing protein At2g33680-like n=1 Tax=Aristolochia californica TaxID=171875 RepID=UPI0035D579C1
MIFTVRLTFTSSRNRYISTLHRCFFLTSRKSTADPLGRTAENVSNTRNEEIQVLLQSCASLLQQSGDLRDINYGKSLHSVLFKCGFNENIFIQNNLLQMYAVCGELRDARAVFDEIPEPNLVSWTSMMSSYIHHGYTDHGLQLFSVMCHSGLRPNEFGFSSAVKACRILCDLCTGKLLHGFIIKCGFEFYFFCGTSILDLYVKSGYLADARKYFDGIPLKCEALWNTLIDGYVKSSFSKEVVQLFNKMFVSDIRPSCFTYSILLKMCVDLLDLNLGRVLHCLIIKSGFENNSFVGSALVELYAKWEAMEDACRVFWSLEERDNVVCSSLLSGFHQSGEAELGVNLVLAFFSEGYRLDPFMLVSVFNLCSGLETPGLGIQVHCWYIKSGFVLDSFVGSAIVDMYASFGMASEAYESFLIIIDKNSICFDAMIAGFVSNLNYRSAIDLFSEMRELLLVPSCSTLNHVLGAYVNLDMLDGGRAIHCHIMKTLGVSNPDTGNAVLEMYTKGKKVVEAFRAFKEMEVANEFSWTTIISACNDLGEPHEALKLFHDFHSSTFMKPSQYTLVAIVQACSRLVSLDQGKQIHGYIIRLGFEPDSFIGSSLISMYAKCNSISDASLVFSNMYKRDLVLWSSIIAAYTQHGHAEEALKHFSEYQNYGLAIDVPILTSCFSACATLAAVDKGQCVHAITVKTGFELDIHVGCAIIDMYCKCGSIRDARKFFNNMKDQNVVSWTAMVCGYAQHGFAKEALDFFNEMKAGGMEPDAVTFIGVLSACSHVGFVMEGWHYFNAMEGEYGLDRTINHYACMVDLLGRAGHMTDAEQLINKAPFQSKTTLWRTLLGACCKHGNLEVGKRIAKVLIKVEPNEPSNYVLLSKLYASACVWEPSTQIRENMRVIGMTKDPGCSWIEVAA